MENILNFRQNFITSVDELDYLERLKPSAIMQYFQDLATTHAKMIGVGFEEMQEQNLYWVLSRLSMVIDEYPALGDEISVVTYPRKPAMVDATRDYFITGSKGQSIARGTSKWCVLDTKSHAIRRCSPNFNYDDSAYYTSNIFENGNQRLSEIKTVNPVPLLALSSKVRITDLDRNVHMNNARYGDIVLNSCDIEFLNTHIIKAFDINFISELKIGENFNVLKADKDGDSYFESFKGSDENNVVFRAKIKWGDFKKK